MCNSCVSIKLSPEFGWSIQNKNVFGPGSVIQGINNIIISSRSRLNIQKKNRFCYCQK